jgi:hypothetical protein
MVLLVILSIAGGIIAWTAGIGLQLILGDGMSTSLQFRFFVGIALAFAVGGSAHLKNKRFGIIQNHGGWLAAFSIPGVLFAAPLYLLPADWSGLSIVAVIWGILAGGVGHLLSRMITPTSR